MRTPDLPRLRRRALHDDRLPAAAGIYRLVAQSRWAGAAPASEVKMSAALTTNQIDYRARCALEFALGGAPEMPPETAAPVVYAGTMAAAYTGIAAALHLGNGYDPGETAKIGAAAALAGWRDIADDAAAAFQHRPPGAPEPQDWRVCYAIPLHCSYREPGLTRFAARCPETAAYITIRRDAPAQTAGWCEVHVAGQPPPGYAHFALYPALQADWAMQQHILLHSLESLAIGGEDDDDELIALSNAARLLAGEIRGRLDQIAGIAAASIAAAA